MGAECPILVLVAGLYEAGSMAVALGCLTPACLKNHSYGKTATDCNLSIMLSVIFASFEQTFINYVHK